MSDSKFQGESVVVEGRFLNVNCWDSVLDHPDRRSTGTGKRREDTHIRDLGQRWFPVSPRRAPESAASLRK